MIIVQQDKRGATEVYRIRLKEDLRPRYSEKMSEPMGYAIFVNDALCVARYSTLDQAQRVLENVITHWAEGKTLLYQMPDDVPSEKQLS